MDVSVVIPVKNAGALFGRVLAAVRAQGDLELIIIDSGSLDDSREIARRAGGTLIEIEPQEFGHGRTRNLGAARASGELVCFLTQDAIPIPGWLDAFRASFALAERVGAAYGPHLPHPHTSPMIARELTEFFGGFAPKGSPAIQREGDLSFLSNVNSCYLRTCWEEIRFPDVSYAEDQAFGRAMLEAGWAKVYQPAAAVHHAHDYGPVEFMKRYFDEYRGLQQASGHVEPLRPLDALRQVRRDARWMREREMPVPERARWIARSAVHHGGRRVASALGSRAQRLPAGAQAVLSLEGQGRTLGQDTGGRERRVAAKPGTNPYEVVLRLNREGPARLAHAVPGMASRTPLHVAVVIPPFQRGSGGHKTLFTLMARLERKGHSCSVWMFDPYGRHYEPASVLRRRIVEEFEPLEAPAFKGFDDWHGADVALATGWDTAYAVALLTGCRARAYLIQDHEPEFWATSAQSLWAAGTYELGFHGIAAGRWLHDLVEERYGQRGTWFRLGVDRTVYRPGLEQRRRDTVIFYARESTPRRAVPLGTLALQELRRRRPDTRLVLFGEVKEMRLPFDYEHLGVVSPGMLARQYAEATAGMCLSTTNYSLIPQEMLACGLPCVDLAGGSTEAEMGRDGGVELAAADPLALADALERLLSDQEHWRRRAEAGLAFVEAASWEVAGESFEAGLREALRERERAI